MTATAGDGAASSSSSLARHCHRPPTLQAPCDTAAHIPAAFSANLPENSI